MPSLTPASSPETRPSTAAERPTNVRVAARQELNAQIVTASLNVSIKSGDDSLALLYRSAIDSINERLEAELGPNAIQNAAANQDNTPEATAGRILDFATNFFDAYAAQRPNDDPEQVAKDFVELIRGGFEKGFGEARDILQGLGVFNGEVESGVMKTYELVHKGLDDFLAGKLAPPTTEAGTEAAADKPAA
ncbi:hypothetical protein E6C76_21510 [Pseudothauera nasutitermitis]|uniref:DUF5610 domain-containing protein n=1 Tax=Pseudothauera nasutitermitis TaxID=2565930 RepID=A0A4S4AMD1_9RHOO|nr:DUF5610 domain-containing protein [Pseudothauera nasutitermitis]THF60761.1 hypothetical protein E6C76_21510 [Pseudothauera nasutitermitis]